MNTNLKKTIIGIIIVIIALVVFYVIRAAMQDAPTVDLICDNGNCYDPDDKDGSGEIGKGTTFNSDLVYKQDSPLWEYSETYPKQLGEQTPVYGGPGYVVIFKQNPTFLYVAWTKGGVIAKDANGKMYYEKGYEKILPADIAKKVDEVLSAKGYAVLKYVDYGGYDEVRYTVTDY